MRVCRDAGDARDAEVEHGDVVAELLSPRQDEAAEASVYMQADAPRQGEIRHLRDRVDRAVAVVAGRAHHRDRVPVDRGRDRVDVGERRLGVDRNVPALDTQQVACLVERRVRGLGFEEVGPVDAALASGLLAVGEHRVKDAAAPSRCHEAGRLGAVHRVGMQQVQRHRDDLALELRHARAHVAL